MAYSPINTVPVVEGRGDVQLEFPVAGEGDLDDGGAGRVVDGAAVIKLGRKNSRVRLMCYQGKSSINI